MQRDGYIRISRKAFRAVEAGGDDFWNEPRKFSRWEAWEYLIMAAAYADHDYLAGSTLIRIQRGETPPLATRFLMRAWGWSSSRTVYEFLSLLVRLGRIVKRQTTRTGDTYVLVNYDKYQNSGTQGETESKTLGETQLKRKRNASETKQKKEKKEKQGNIGGASAPPPKRGYQLPNDWQPTPDHRTLAASLSVDAGREAEQFRDHARATGRTMKDWDAAFRTWLRKAAEFQRNRRGFTGTEAERARRREYEPTLATPNAQTTLQRIDGERLEMDAARKNRERVDAWSKANQEEAAALWQTITEEYEVMAVPAKLKQGMAEAEYRRRVLERLKEAA